VLCGSKCVVCGECPHRGGVSHPPPARSRGAPRRAGKVDSISAASRRVRGETREAESREEEFRRGEKNLANCRSIAPYAARNVRKGCTRRRVPGGRCSREGRAIRRQRKNRFEQVKFAATRPAVDFYARACAHSGKSRRAYSEDKFSTRLTRTSASTCRLPIGTKFTTVVSRYHTRERQETNSNSRALAGVLLESTAVVCRCSSSLRLT